MKISHPLIILAFIVFSCQSNVETEQKTAAFPVTYHEISGAEAKKTAAIVIEGMSCEMACVSAVNKTVSALEGTKSIDIHFDAALSLDTCFVEFDESTISPTQLGEAIQACNGGIYKVKSIDVMTTSTDGTSTGSPSSNRSSIEEREKVQYSKFKFPSLIDLIKGVGL